MHIVTGIFPAFEIARHRQKQAMLFNKLQMILIQRNPLLKNTERKEAVRQVLPETFVTCYAGFFHCSPLPEFNRRARSRRSAV